MRLAADDPHREYFLENQAIEFESVLAEEEAHQLKQEILSISARRLHVKPDKLRSVHAQKIFDAGRDLWRESAFLKSRILNRRFGEIVHQLTQARQVRIGYDQLFPAMDFTSKLVKSKYEEFLQQTATLKQISSLQGVLCGALFGFNDEEASSVPGVFPAKKTNVLFFGPDKEIPWNTILLNSRREYYLVVFTSGTSLYVLNPQDPYSRFLLKEGYSQGDRLNDALNPLIFR